MLGYLDLLDRDATPVRFHPLETRSITNVIGLPGLGMAGAREVVTTRPSYHGTVTRSKWLKSKLLTIEGWVRGGTHEMVQAELDKLTGPLFDALDTDRLLLWRRGETGPELQATVRWSESDMQVTPDAAGRLLRYQANLHLDDPRGYSQTPELSTSGAVGDAGGGDSFADVFPDTFTAAGGATAAFQNDGTVPTPPILRLYANGANLVNPQVKLEPNGPSIVIVGTIGAGDFLELDVARRKVLLGGTLERPYLVDFSDSRWFELPRGGGTVRMLAQSSAATAYMTVEYRHAFL